jgi:hypothetical protein
MSSNISCIKMCGKHSPIQRALYPISIIFFT